MSDRPTEFSTADLAGRQTREQDRPEVVDDTGRQIHPAGENERLVRDDESDGLGDRSAGDGVDVVTPDHPATGPAHGADVGTGGAAGVGAEAGAGVGFGVHSSSGPGNGTPPLLASRDAEGFRARWTDVQTSFVDSPRHSVEQADALVAELMQHLATTFSDERSSLEQQWDRGDDIATDDLRTAFQRYRSFFERLLAT